MNYDVILFGYNKYPNKNPSARRMSSIRFLFEKNNYSCFSIGTQKEEYESIKTVRKYNGNFVVKKIIDRFFWGQRTYKFIKKNFKYVQYICFDTTFDSFFYLKKIFNFSRANGIKIIFAPDEYYSKCEFKLGALSYGYKINHRIIKFCKNNKTPTICISKYFQNLMNNAKTYYLPIVFENKNFRFNVSEQLSFLYCGNPGKKDDLTTILEAFYKIYKENQNYKCTLYLIGFTPKLLKRYFKKIPSDNLNIKIVKYLPVEELNKFYLSSSFSLLLRNENKIYAKAGFPSKIVESLSFGLPVITNYTSDLSLYLDTSNSIEVNCDDEESFLNALKIANAIGENEILSMKTKAKETFNKYFDVTLYVDSFLKFLGDIDGKETAV